MAEINKIIKNARDVLVGKVPDPQSQIDQITLALIYKFMIEKREVTICPLPFLWGNMKIILSREL